MRKWCALGVALVVAAALLVVVPPWSPHVAAQGGVAATNFQEDAAHDGHVDDPAFNLPLHAAWTKTFEGSVWTPLIVGSQVFVDVAHYDFRDDPNAPSDAPHGSSVYALDVSTGAPEWGPVDMGGDFSWGSLAFDNGTLYAANSDGLVAAIDPASGAVRWKAYVWMPNDLCRDPVTATGGSVYLACSGTAATVYVFRGDTGDYRWAYDTDNSASSPAVTATDVIAASGCDDAYDFAPADGSLRWHHAGTCYTGTGEFPAVANGRVYVPNWNGPSDILDQNTGATLAQFYPGALVAPPAIDAPMMYTAFRATNCSTCAGAWSLVAEDAGTGALKWQDGSKDWVMTLSVNDKAVAAAMDGTVEVVDGASGSQLWSANTGSATDGPADEWPVCMAEANGYLAVPGQKSLTVFASSPQSATPTPTPTPSPTPTATATPAVGATTSAPATGASGSSSTGSSAGAASSASASPASATSSQTSGASPAVTAGWRATYDYGRSALLNWNAAGNGSGVTSFDVRYTTAGLGGRFGRYVYPSAYQRTSARSLHLPIAAGATICASVRAHDATGNVSRWTLPRCTTRLIDDRRLLASSQWSRTGARGAYDGTLTATAVHGATLKSSGIGPARIAIVAMTCPTCGTVLVRVPGRSPVELSLKSSAARLRLLVIRTAGNRAGAVSLTVVSHRGLVEIDALGVLSTMP